jgi:hypothetical protein
MKRPFLGLIALSLLTMLGPVPMAYAHWWWHHHSSPPAAGAGADNKSKRTKAGREPGMAKPVALYGTPKSLGWWHKYPGPMGAGGEQVAKNQTMHSESAKPQDSAQNTHPHHSLFAWLHHHHNEAQTTAQPTPPPAPAPTSATNSNDQ